MAERNNSEKRMFCGHCNRLVSKSCYYVHRKLYYNRESKKWCPERVYHSNLPTLLPSQLQPAEPATISKEAESALQLPQSLTPDTNCDNRMEIEATEAIAFHEDCPLEEVVAYDPLDSDG